MSPQLDAALAAAGSAPRARRVLVATDERGVASDETLRAASRFAERLDQAPQLLAVTESGRASVVRLAADWHADLVVLGAPQGWGARRALGAGAASALLRADRCPVLAVGPEADGVVHRAVAGVAFGPASARAAALACRLLAPGGVLSLVHVHETVGLSAPTWDERGAPSAPSAGAQLQRLAAAVRSGTAEAAADGTAARRDVMVGTATLFGGAAVELVDYARRVGAELISVGAGHVAEEVVRQARKALPGCSVLVCPTD